MAEHLMVSLSDNRAITPRLLELVIAYVETGSSATATENTGVTVWTIRAAVTTMRRHLTTLGYTNVGNQIGLRAALRDHGDIDHLNPI
jgi:hypothetical protein